MSHIITLVPLTEFVIGALVEEILQSMTGNTAETYCRLLLLIVASQDFFPLSLVSLQKISESRFFLDTMSALSKSLNTSFLLRHFLVRILSMMYDTSAEDRSKLETFSCDIIRSCRSCVHCIDDILLTCARGYSRLLNDSSAKRVLESNSFSAIIRTCNRTYPSETELAFQQMTTRMQNQDSPDRDALVRVFTLASKNQPGRSSIISLPRQSGSGEETTTLWLALSHPLPEFRSSAVEELRSQVENFSPEFSFDANFVSSVLESRLSDDSFLVLSHVLRFPNLITFIDVQTVIDRCEQILSDISQSSVISVCLLIFVVLLLLP